MRDGTDHHTATAETTSLLTRRILAPNAGPMTLDGTNSYLLAAPDAGGVVVVDPGPLDEGHLAALAAFPVELVLLTHRHLDHSESRSRFAELTGAPVRAQSPERKSRTRRKPRSGSMPSASATS